MRCGTEGGGPARPNGATMLDASKPHGVSAQPSHLEALSASSLHAAWQRQHQAHLAHPLPSYAERMGHLQALARMLQDHRAEIVAAINADFGSRSTVETLFAEYFVVLGSIRHARQHLRQWMQPQRRGVDRLLYPGARNGVQAQPLGVVGVIVPWNFPLHLALEPLVGIFAAGNRAMVKMSQKSAHLAALLVRISPRYFAAEKLQFLADHSAGASDGVSDGDSIGRAFSALPLDHLLFTGSTGTGRAVMAQAAVQLTPVTLELGGKSPAIVGPDCALSAAVQRILWAKLFNAGQICTSVDYVFVPQDRVEAFVRQCQYTVARRYPDIQHADYTAIIDASAYARLELLLEDARAKGGVVVNLAPGQTPDALPNRSLRKFPPHVVLHPRADMLLCQQEIFGPILPLHSYRQPQEVVHHLQHQPKPLALYLFTRRKDLQRYYLDNTLSGGVTINDVLLHAVQDQLPFGGVGASGMGHYHGHDGFLTFSKSRPVFRQGLFSAVQCWLQPPYTARTLWWLNLLLRWRT